MKKCWKHGKIGGGGVTYNLLFGKRRNPILVEI